MDREVFVALAVIIVFLVGYIVLLQIRVRALTKQVVRGGTQSVKAITSVTYTLSELVKTLDRDSNLSRHERDQIIRLVVDVEKRITDAINNHHRMHSGPVVTVNDFNGDNAQVAQGKRVEQK
jgi:uncharacterized protein YoxC